MAMSAPGRFQPLTDALDCEQDDNLEEVNEHQAEAEQNARTADEAAEDAAGVTVIVIEGDASSPPIDHASIGVEMSLRSSSSLGVPSQLHSRSTVGLDQSAEVYPSRRGSGVTTGSVCHGHKLPQFQSCHSGRSGLHASDDPQNAWSVNFSILTYLEEYMVHLFGPLAYPYLRYRYTKAFAQNHDLLALWGRGATGVWWHLSFVMLVCLFAIYGSSPRVTTSEMVLAILIFLSRNSIIAAKYAYLSPLQIEERKQRYLDDHELRYQLLLAGWYVLPRPLQRTELDHSFTRLAIPDNEKSYATFVGRDRPSVIAQLQANIPDEDFPPDAPPEWREARDKGRLHIRLLCERFISDAVNSIRYPWMVPIVMTVSLVHCIIPMLCRVAQDQPPFGEGWHEIVQTTIAILITFPNLSASLMFVLVGLLDYKRRIFLMNRCSGLLVDSYLTDETARSTHQYVMPLLNFSRANNVGIWLETRQLLKDFGLQFFMRVQAYSSFWVFSVIWMLGFLFYQILFTARAETTGILLVCFDLSIVGVSLFFMLGAAKRLNSQHIEHRKILLKKLSEMTRHVSLLTKSDPASLAYAQSIMASKKMVKVAIQVLETDDELSPVKILGFNANDGLVRALVTGAGSGLLAAAKLLWDK